jgi:pimeloyl-ACP methyl ester carboxylesterase
MNHLILVLLAALAALPACRSVTHLPAASTAAPRSVGIGASLAAAEAATRRGLVSSQDRDAYAAAISEVVAHYSEPSTAQVSRDQPGALSLPGADNSLISASLVTSTGVPGQSGELRIWQFDVQTPAGLRVDALAPAPEPAKRQFGRQITREGVGVPMVAVWNWTEERARTEPFLRETGFATPVTVTLDFAPAKAARTRVRLVVSDPRTTERVTLAGRRHPLAADFSAVGEWLYAQALARKSAMPGLKAMMNVGANLDKIGLIALEPPSSDRIPVVLVHGLMSNPFTWHTVLNELSADPVLHRSYQVFAFRYPSGVPVSYSSRRLRDDLATLDRSLRAAGNRRADRMVVIGHSMGGLLAKAQVVDTGDRLWRALFDAPRDKVNLTEAQKAMIAPYIEFSANPSIERVVFMNTPHRGSQLAQGVLGAFGRGLIRLPFQVMGPAFDILRNDDEVDPAIRHLARRGVPSSIQNLSPTSFFVRASNELPFRPGLHRHSVIGNKEGRPLDDPKCSDGVVPYSSAHLAGVESELVVPGDHSSFHTAPAIAELRRILLLHLAKEPSRR